MLVNVPISDLLQSLVNRVCPFTFRFKSKVTPVAAFLLIVVKPVRQSCAKATRKHAKFAGSLPQHRWNYFAVVRISNPEWAQLYRCLQTLTRYNARPFLSTWAVLWVNRPAILTKLKGYNRLTFRNDHRWSNRRQKFLRHGFAHYSFILLTLLSTLEEKTFRLFVASVCVK